MSRITEVPNSTVSHLAPGWAFVPDTGFDPSKVAIQPTGRKRKAARAFGGPAVRSDALSQRQNNIIIKHIAELDKENHREVNIPIPARKKDGAGRASRGGATANVRKILAYQKTFRHWIDDEEAELEIAQKHSAQAAAAAQARGGRAAAARNASTPSRSTPSVRPLPQVAKEKVPVPKIEPAADGTEIPATVTEEQLTQLIATEDDDDPLLKSYVPRPPSKRVMDALLAEPQLTWNVSRAKPSTSGRPQRHFCAMCGYWGKIKCKNCFSRVCGLDCYKTHQATNCSGGLYT